MDTAFPSHVAVLVPSLQKAADSLRPFDFRFGEPQAFEEEGTRELYVERERANALLLMEAILPGPYRRAFEKRGPGLHHLGVTVLSLEACLKSARSEGWRLHPLSAETIEHSRCAWLSRPGFPALLEVQEGTPDPSRPLFIREMTLKMDALPSSALKPFGLETRIHPGAENELELEGRRLRLDRLWASNGL